MNSRKEWVPVVGALLGIGFIVALVAGRSPAPPYGGAVGALIGIGVAVYQTMNTPKSMRKRQFTIWLRSGVPGGYRRDDSRTFFVFMMALACGVSAGICQLIILGIQKALR